MKASSSVSRALGGDEGARCIAGEHAPRVHEGDAIAAGPLVHEVRGDEDRDPLVAGEIDQQLPELIAGEGIHPRGWLVENQDFRLVDDRHGQGEPLTEAHWKLRCQVIDHLAQAKALQEIGDSLLHCRLGEVEESGVELEVLPYGELRVERKALRHVADQPAELAVARLDFRAKEAGRPFRGRKQAGQHLHRGGLPASVGAEEAEDLTAFDPEARAIDGSEVPEAPGQVLRLDHELGSGSRARGGRESSVSAAPPLREELDIGLFEGRRFGPGLELRGRARGQDASGVHHDEPVEAVGFFHVRRGDDHAHALATGLHSIDELPELTARQRVHPGGGLVQDEQIGVVDQGAAQSELLLHSSREVALAPAGERREPGALQQLPDAPPALGAALPEEAPEEVNALDHREIGVEVSAQSLRHISDPRADAAPVKGLAHVAPEGDHAAVLDLAHTRDQAEQRRLALPHPARSARPCGLQGSRV